MYALTVIAARAGFQVLPRPLIRRDRGPPSSESGLTFFRGVTKQRGFSTEIAT